ncbi:MAG: hypothetical protein U0V48_03980 [Anaerolineales bacterium]
MTRAFMVMPTFASAAAGRMKRHTSTYFERMRRSQTSSFSFFAAREAVEEKMSPHRVETSRHKSERGSGWCPQIRRGEGMQI